VFSVFLLFYFIKKMTRVNNHRALVRAGASKKKSSKKVRGSMRFWRTKALQKARLTEDKQELKEQFEKVEGRKRQWRSSWRRCGGV
jgi:hypothetical protein